MRLSSSLYSISWLVFVTEMDTVYSAVRTGFVRVTKPFGWAGTRAQSGDWYGSGMLLSGQSLRGRLPLLSPAFRHSNLRRQVPPRLHDTREPSSEGWHYGREYCQVIQPKWRLPRHSGIFNMPQSTTWDRRLYSPSEGRRAEDFFALKIRRLRPRVCK